MREQATRRSARLARERRMKDQQRKRVGDALPRGLRRMRSWIRRQRKNKSRLRAWMSWSLVVIVIVGGLFAISSTHLANIQNAISGITQPPVGQAVSSGSTPRSDTLAPMALTQYVNPLVGSDWAGRSFGYGVARVRGSGPQ